jgi:apolipoprotein N-acyltransferase
MKRSLIWLLANLLSVVGGLLVAAAFPPWNQDWLIWVGFTPVLAGLVLFRRGRLAALIQGALFGGTFGGMAFSWLWKGGRMGDWCWNTGSLALVGAFWGFIVSLLVKMPGRSGHQKLSPILPGHGPGATAWNTSVTHLKGALLTAAAWTVLEWIRGFVIPQWNAVGTVIQSNLPLLQISAVLGPSGLTFAAVFSNFIVLAAVRRLILEPGRMTWASRFDVTATLGVLFLAGIAGFWWLQRKPTGSDKKVGLICPNTDNFDRLLELTKQQSREEIDLFVWRSANFGPNDYNRLADAMSGRPVALVSGTTSGGSGLVNGATIVTPGAVRNLILFPNRRDFFQPGTGSIGRGLNPFTFSDVTWVPFVNWDAADVRLVRAAVARQMQVIIAITNPIPGHGATEQFFENLRLWSTSLGRPLIFASNAKFAAIVAASGRIVAGGRTGSGEDAWTGQITVPGPFDSTLYGRYGDWFAIACGAVCLVTGLSERLRSYGAQSVRGRGRA